MRYCLLLLFLISTGCTKKAAPLVEVESGSGTGAGTGAGAGAGARKEMMQKLAAPIKDPHLTQIMKVSTQADQVLRETWWVISGDRQGPGHSPFGNFLRAATEAQEGKLASKGLFLCDRYHVTTLSAGPPNFSISISEVCTKGSPKELGSWTMPTGAESGAGRARVEFVSQNLSEVLGLNAGVFGRRMICELRWNDKGILDSMSCPLWEQDRANQLVRLDVFQYQREGHALVRVRGQVLENLAPVRKIETTVPLEGKIIVTETQLNAPPDIAPKPAAPVRPAAVAVPAPGVVPVPTVPGTAVGGRAGVRPAKNGVHPAAVPKPAEPLPEEAPPEQPVMPYGQPYFLPGPVPGTVFIPTGPPPESTPEPAPDESEPAAGSGGIPVAPAPPPDMNTR